MASEETIMTALEPRGFAGPIDYDRYGYYIPKPPEGHSVLAAYRFGFRDRISTDGSTPFAAETGRYHLYVSLGCPWAQRAAILIALLGLEEAISISIVDDVRDGRGWAFRARRGADPINDFSFLKQAYLATEPSFEGHINVPTLWDRKTNRVVNNADDDIFWDIATQFDAFARNPIDIYPLELREDMDRLDKEIHDSLNFGVYETGLAPDQQSYEAGVKRAFDTLDRLELRLNESRFLFGDDLVESDVRLWVTLARFDIVYNPLFRVNLRRLTDYPNLWGYARDLYAHPAFRARSDFAAIKANYWVNLNHLNPSSIVPVGPLLEWDTPHDRRRLSADKI